MANKRISELPAVSQVGDNDLFVLEQANVAKKLTGQLLKTYAALDIVSVTITMLAEGATPTASYNATTKVLALNIPKGDTGDDGISPVASVSKSGTVTTLTVTDRNGTTTAQINDGTNGTDGDDGVSPTVSISKVGKVTTITITDANGTHTATINDGADGQGAGDMLKADYDASSAVLNAGGIAAYVAAHAGQGDMTQAVYDSAGTVSTAGGIVAYVAGQIGAALEANY